MLVYFSVIRTSIILDWPPITSKVIAVIVFGITFFTADFFLRRYTVYHKHNRSYCTECGYDLRATLQIGREQCPECGRRIIHPAPDPDQVASALEALSEQAKKKDASNSPP